VGWPHDLYSTCFGTVLLLPFVPHLVHDVRSAPWLATWSVVYLGVFPAAIANTLWSYSLSKVPASRLAACMYLMPPIAIAIAWLVNDEVPRRGRDRHQPVGGVGQEGRAAEHADTGFGGGGVTHRGMGVSLVCRKQKKSNRQGRRERQEMETFLGALGVLGGSSCLFNRAAPRHATN
jgi:hypothetical protein